jgi:hypothetical protein
MFMPPTLNNPKLIGEEILSCLVLVLKLCMHMLKEKTRYIFPTTNTTYACLNLDVVRRVIMYLLSSHVCARIRCIIAHAPQYETIA